MTIHLAVSKIVLCLSGLFIFAEFAFADPFVSDSVTVETYSVSGTTLQQLERDMRRKGPNGYWAQTKTSWSWDDDCNMTFLATIVMPRLTNRNSLEPSDLAEWDRMKFALRTHEDEHVAIGRRWAADIKASNCDDTRLEEINSKWRRFEYMFDRNTQHGRTQGVYLIQ